MALVRQLFLSADKALKLDGLEPTTKTSSLVNSDLLFGVELELEGCTHELPESGGVSIVGSHRLPTGLLAHKDGSLRNGGIELVTAPVRGANLVTLVEFICTLANKAGWTPSNRAGLHIHINVQDLTIEKYLNLLKLYTLVEPCFFNAAGYERGGSIYCKSWWHGAANDELKSCMRTIATGRFYGVRSRYLGLNINSISKYGTVEFRHKHSTTDAAEILAWINMIARLYNYAMANDISEYTVKGMTPDALVQNVFGGTVQMDAEFPSVFYHSCLPLWFDLFAEAAKPELTWKRTTKKPHKGFSKFLAGRPIGEKPAPRPKRAAFLNVNGLMLDGLPPVQEESPLSRYNTDHNYHYYFQSPPISHNHRCTGEHKFFAGRFWTRGTLREDLWCSLATNAEADDGAHEGLIYMYGEEI